MPGRPAEGLSDGDDGELIELHIAVPRERDGWRLDRFLHDRIPRLSRTRLRRVISEEVSLPDGSLPKPARLVRAGQVITLRRRPPREPDVPTRFAVAYEDDEVIVIDKPAGLAVHPTARYHRGTLTWLLRERYGDRRPIVTHRLDRETSGLIVCAWTKAAESFLKMQFERRTVDKEYLAIVHGEPEGDSFSIDVPLGPARGSEVRLRMGPCAEGGLPARTGVRVLERLRGRSLVLATPETGRQHQIRAHLSLAGHPVVGDKIYGASEDLFIEFVESGMTDDLLARLELPRHALHAHRIEIDHPSLRDRLVVSSALPADLVAYLDARRTPPSCPSPTSPE